MKVNVELCIDLKTRLQNDAVMKPGKDYAGILRHDLPCDEFGFEDCHYTFVETPPTTDGRRNPHVFVGRYITVTRRGDGTLRINLRQIRVHTGNIDSYALGVCDELREALRGLVGEDVE